MPQTVSGGTFTQGNFADDEAIEMHDLSSALVREIMGSVSVEGEGVPLVNVANCCKI